MEFYIRIAKNKDVDSLNLLFQKLLEYERENYDKNIKDNLCVDSFFDNKISDQNNVILVAQLDKKIVGYLYGYVDDTNKIKAEFEAFINSIYVEEQYRNEGIGTELIKNFIDKVKSKNAKYVYIENLVSNEVAKYLYSKLGFNLFKENRKLELGD